LRLASGPVFSAPALKECGKGGVQRPKEPFTINQEKDVRKNLIQTRNNQEEDVRKRHKQRTKRTRFERAIYNKKRRGYPFEPFTTNQEEDVQKSHKQTPKGESPFGPYTSNQEEVELTSVICKGLKRRKGRVDFHCQSKAKKSKAKTQVSTNVIRRPQKGCLTDAAYVPVVRPSIGLTRSTFLAMVLLLVRCGVYFQNPSLYWSDVQSSICVEGVHTHPKFLSCTHPTEAFTTLHSAHSTTYVG
jgi:hypothetical protein